MARYSFSLKDLNRAALERLVEQLAAASDSEEQSILQKLSKGKKDPPNHLADLHEQMHGKPNTPKVQEDSPFDLGSDTESPDEDANENSESDMQPPKKGKK